MKPNEMKVWFPAKRYGWGWGPPNCWEGWMVMLMWIVLLSAGRIILLPEYPEVFFGYTGTLVVILISICFLKGEKSRWRWGKD